MSIYLIWHLKKVWFSSIVLINYLHCCSAEVNSIVLFSLRFIAAVFFIYILHILLLCVVCFFSLNFIYRCSHFMQCVSCHIAIVVYLTWKTRGEQKNSTSNKVYIHKHSVICSNWDSFMPHTLSLILHCHFSGIFFSFFSSYFLFVRCARQRQ